MVNHCIDAVERDTLNPEKKESMYRKLGFIYAEEVLWLLFATQFAKLLFARDPQGPCFARSPRGLQGI